MRTCNKCNQTKDESLFETNKSRSGAPYLRRTCRLCRRNDFLDRNPTYFSTYYENNREVINKKCVAITRRNRQKRREKLAILKSGPCADCGKHFPSYVLDFDHRDPSQKVAEVSLLAKLSYKWETVLREIEKCDLVCSNCHHLRTYQGDSNYRSRRHVRHRKVIDRLKAEIPCLDCDTHFQPCQMEFDHTGVGTKVNNISQMLGGRSEALVAEIAKCHLVCSNCHRERSYSKQRTDNPSHSLGLVALFYQILGETPLPEDKRYEPFPYPDLLGVVRDKELAKMAGMSKAMVSWYRRKAGIRLDSKGRTRSAKEAV